MSRMKKICKRIGIGLALFATVLAVIWCIGRYGWKLRGFAVAQSAVVENVEVTDGQVHITGCYYGSFPEGFLGYISKEEDGKLYVGYKYSALFGIFETGQIDITIPVKGPIDTVYTKTKTDEWPVWERDKGMVREW